MEMFLQPYSDIPNHLDSKDASTPEGSVEWFAGFPTLEREKNYKKNMQATSGAAVQIGVINFTQGCLKLKQQLLVTLQRSTHTVGDHKDGRWRAAAHLYRSRECILFATEVPLVYKIAFETTLYVCVSLCSSPHWEENPS